MAPPPIPNECPAERESMTTDEWQPPPPLTEDAAAALIKKAFPAIDTNAIGSLGSGGQYDVFLTSDDWVFRFPRWEWSAKLFEPEARIHRFVAEILPSQIRIPRVELVAKPTSQFPYPFAGHRFIPGVAADAIDDELKPTLTREIAIFLSAVHSTPVPVAGAAGIHEFEMNQGRREWLEHGIAVATQLRGLDPAVDRAIDWLATKPVQPPAGGALHLIHGDLSPEHLLVDPTTGFLGGVIDWTDTMLGDVARDFVFLVTWQGWRFAEDVLRHYPRAVDNDFRVRLRYIAQLLSIIWLAFSHEQGADTTKHLQAVRNAFAAHEP